MKDRAGDGALPPSQPHFGRPATAINVDDRAALRLEDEMLARTKTWGRNPAQPTLNVIFDVETLLLDPARGMRESLHVALCKSGLKTLAQKLEGTGRGPVVALRDLLAELLDMQDSTQVEAALRSYARHYAEHGRYRCRFRPGSLQLLATLAATPGVELHYLTHIGVVAAAKVLDVYGLQHVSRSVYTGENPCCPGLRPTLIREWLEPRAPWLGDWALLSDYPPELAVTKRLGLRSIGLGYGRVPMATLRRLQLDAVVDDLTGVSRALLQRADDNAPDTIRPALACLH